uniref:Uncharacterized protein n=1 Tax=Desulfobacca acetoxidans TaxID=60893 RepID=A0A7V4LDC1_9BACT
MKSRSLMSLALLAGVLALLAPRPASPGAEAGWDTYANARFGYALSYPRDRFIPQGEAANGDGQRFVSPDGEAVLTVWGSHNALGQSLTAHCREAAAGFGGRVTYQVIKPGWYVISGVTGNRLYYQKTYLVDDMFKSFSLEYPAARRGEYDPLAAALGRSFRIR